MLGLWLRMAGYVNGEGFTIPDSQASYNANGSIADAVYPSHGGVLQADGTWTQDAAVLGNAFSLALPAQADTWGQLYMPFVECDPAGVHTVLASPALMQTAVDDLMALALTGRFDSPWDGVTFDLENIQLAYRAELSTFMTMLANAVHAAGLLVQISVKGKRIDGGGSLPGSSRYTYDYSVMAGLCDYFDMRVYGYPGTDSPLGTHLDYIGPYEWALDCVNYALSVGVRRDTFLLSAGNFSTYWPMIGVASSVSITHADAAILVAAVPTYTTWIETDGTGVIREQYAALGADQVWMRDHNVLNHDLGLATDKGLLGVNLFVPGMGTANQWTDLNTWLTATSWHGYVLVENLNLAAGQYATFLTIAQGQGQQADDMPAYITHSRVLSGTETVVEAIFRFGEMAQDQCVEWLAAVLDVDPAGVSSAAAGNVWTLSHGGTDYVDMTLFGGFGSAWDTSGAACRAYVG